jgi:hypothetical protein
MKLIGPDMTMIKLKVFEYIIMGNTGSTRKHTTHKHSSTDKHDNNFSKYVRSSTFKRHNKFKTRRHNYKKHHKKRYHGGVYGSSLKNVVNANSEGEAVAEEPRKSRKLPIKRSIMDRGKVKNLTIHSLKGPTIEGRLDREEAERRARLSREADASPGTPRKRSPGKSADAEVAAIRKAKSDAAKLLEERKSHTLSRQRERDRLLLFGGPKSNPLFKKKSGSVSKLEPMIEEEE